MFSTNRPENLDLVANQILVQSGQRPTRSLARQATGFPWIRTRQSYPIRLGRYPDRMVFLH